MIRLRRGERTVVRVGHRGAAALAPENTVAAIETAIAHGLDMVEIDVVHLPGRGLVLAHALEVAGEAPLFDEALEFLAATGIGIQVDVKGTGHEVEIVRSLRRYGLLERSFASSFSRSSLRALQAAEPSLPRSVTYPDDRLGLTRLPALAPLVRAGLGAARRTLPARIGRWLRETGAAAATLHWSVVTPATVARCHAADAAVYAWTVNDAETAKALLGMDIDGIITDDPRIFPGLLQT